MVLCNKLNGFASRQRIAPLNTGSLATITPNEYVKYLPIWKTMMKDKSTAINNYIDNILTSISVLAFGFIGCFTYTIKSDKDIPFR